MSENERNELKEAVLAALHESSIASDERIRSVATEASRHAAHEMVKAMGFDPEKPEEARALVMRITAWVTAIDTAKATGWTTLVRMVVIGIGTLIVGGVAAWVVSVAHHSPK